MNKKTVINTLAIQLIVGVGFLSYIGINNLTSKDKGETTPSKEVAKTEINRYTNNQNPDELIIQVGTNYFRAEGLRTAKNGDNLSNITSIETVNKIGGYERLTEAFKPLYVQNVHNMPKIGDPFYSSFKPIDNPAEIQLIQNGISSGQYTPLGQNNAPGHSRDNS